MEIKENSLQQKLQALKEYISSLGSLAVGFSGGNYSLIFGPVLCFYYFE